MKTMTVSEARKAFAQVLELVVRNDEPLVLVRYRRAVAAIVPIDRLSPAERPATKRERDGHHRRR